MIKPPSLSFPKPLGGVLYWLIFSILAIRLILFVNQNAVDLFFYDQWSYLTTSIYPHTILEGFLTPLGPHRIGLGYFFFKAVLVLSDYNNRSIAFLVAGFMIINALIFTYIKRKTIGEIKLTDAYIPLVFFNLHQYAILLKNPNISIHQLVFSVLLLLLLLINDGMNKVKFIGLLILVPIIGFTGNGFFVVLSLIAMSVILAWKQPASKYWWTSISLVGVLTTACYLHSADYSALDCGVHLKESPYFYFMFVRGLVLNGLLISASAGFLKTAIFLLSLFAALWFTVKSIFKSRDIPQLTPLLIMSYVVLFIAATCMGRWCFGLPITESSRYVPQTALGFLALLLIIGRKHTRAYLFCSILMTSFFVYGIPKYYRWKAPQVEKYVQNMRDWKNCYSNSGSARICNEKLHFQPYPGDIGPIKLQNKLEKLEELNPSFKRSKTPPSRP